MPVSFEHAIAQGIASAERYLIEQPPIGTFIHYNILQKWENLPFEEACEAVARQRGSKPYLAHSDYLKHLKTGRIREGELRKVFEEEIRLLFPGMTSKEDEACWALLFVPKKALTSPLLAWHRTQNEGASRPYDFCSKALKTRVNGSELLGRLWQGLSEALMQLNSGPTKTQPALEAINHFLKTKVNDMSIQLASAFFDQGLSYWALPNRDLGFFKASLSLLGNSSLPIPHFFQTKLFRDFSQLSGMEALERYFQSRSFTEKQAREWVEYEIMALPGWAGAFSQFAKMPESLRLSNLKVDLIDYLAVRAILRQNFEAIYPFSHEKGDLPQPSEEDRAATLKLELYELCQCMDSLWIHDNVDFFNASFKKQTETFIRASEMFTDFMRRRILHNAFECSYHSTILSALSINFNINRSKPSTTRKSAGKFSAIFCIDGREESTRRHLEEIDPSFLTYSYAGFFNMDMLYKGIDDHSFAPLCPIVVKPSLRIKEIERPSKSSPDAKKNRALEIGKVRRFLHDGTRGLVWGMPIVSILGILGMVPLALRTVYPRLATLWSKRFSEFLEQKRPTTISHKAIGEFEGDLGMTTEQMVTRVGNLLRGIGLTGNFPAIIFVVGHGANTLNNPHASGYNCGACGGRTGRANARLFAKIANDPDTRLGLRKAGIDIPDGTFFIGTYHDTCSDEFRFLDLADLPDKYSALYYEARQTFAEVQKRNALERCRRFEIANTRSPEAALAHVEGRSWDLREPRAEYGGSTNTVTIVGRRILSQHLFLDRRSFLVSYDPRGDQDGDTLTTLLNAAVPVCLGISLQYYFSHLDSENLGAGTKLSHNVTGLIGVMDGFASDLRTGLPWQMAEIHEAVRNLFIIETEIATMEKIFEGNPYIKKVVANRWIKLALMHPESGALLEYRWGEWVSFSPLFDTLRTVENSLQYCSGKLDHLEPVRILQERALL